ncbi:MAG: Holliday junction branch migration protein RuvA [Clostridia bacterium]|nr:Holliday junction branch migration protein RuvA [Clostridia bacterium]
MIAMVSGTVEYVDENSAVIDAGGVGYRVYMSPANLSRLSAGQSAKVHTFLRVAEGIMDLYGFLTKEELSMFKMLISVSGAGPKAGLAVLSVMTPAEVALAVVTDDYKSITKAPGVGPKVAQKIVLELKDKMKNNDLLSGGAAAESFDFSAPVAGKNDALEALMVLGYTQSEAMRAVRAAGDGLSTEETIKKALLILAKQ